MTAVRARLWHVVASMPAFAIFWSSACFVYNHFYVEGPYLQDSGWYSSIIYHQGFFPKNPPIVHWAPDYYGVHASLLVSVASILSYAFPGERVDWYCFFQGALYVPLGLVVPTLVSRHPRNRLWWAVLVALASLVFAFNGQVLVCLGYPHYEILISGGLCVMLAGLAAGRSTMAWVGLACAAGTREDGGVHATLFLAAVLACGRLNRPFPIERRRLFVMAAVATACSLVAFAIQKMGFQSANLFREEYLGDPAFAHLSGAAIGHRIVEFSEKARFVAFPLLGTLLLALAKRDARYLLGWAAELPWLAMNLLAHQEVKATFSIYTGFPFVASIFWVGAYSRVRPNEPRRDALVLATLAGTSALALVGFYASLPGAATALIPRIIAPRATNRAALLSFVRTLRLEPRAFGRVRRDGALASWTIESAPADSRLPYVMEGPIDGDAVAFFRTAHVPGSVRDIRTLASFPRCGKIDNTQVYFCTKPDRALPPEFRDAPLLLAMLEVSRQAQARDGVISIDASPTPGIAIYGPYGELSPGRYTVAWSLETSACGRTEPKLRVEVTVEAGRVVASREVEPSDKTTTLSLELTAKATAVEFRTWSGACRAVLRDLRIDGL